MMLPPVILRLWLMVLIGNITFTGGRLALLLGARDLGASPFTMGMVITLGSVTGALTAVQVGRWLDRYHHGRILQIGLGCILGSMVLANLRFTLDSMLIASAISGFGINILQIGGQGLTGYYSTAENRPRHYNYIAFALSLSLLLGPAVAGYSIDYLGFGGSYAIFAALAFLASIAISRGLGRPAPKPATAPGEKAGSSLELFRNPGLRRLYLMDLLFATGWNSLGFLVPLYGAQIGLSASAIGTIASTSSFATLLIRLVVPFLSRYLGPWAMFCLALSLTGSGFMAFSFFTHPLVLGGLALLIGSGLGIGLPIAMRLIYEYSPEGRAGEAIGARMLVMRSTNAVMPMAAGQFGALLGVAPVFWIFAGFILWGAWTAGAQARVERRQGAAPP